MAATRLRSASAKRSASITSPARPIGYRSRGSRPRRPRWRVESRTQLRDFPVREPAGGADRGRCNVSRRAEQSVDNRADEAAAAVDTANGPHCSDPCAYCPTELPRAGDHASGRSVAALEPTRIDLFDTATSGSVLPRSNLSVTAWSAANAVLSHRPAEPALATRATGGQPR